MRYPCGCVNEIHHPSGVLHSVSKCAYHRAAYRDPATLDERYFVENGVLKDGVIQSAHYLEQLTEALGPFPGPVAGGDALEVGCGVSPYAGAMEAAGWQYIGFDASSVAIHFMAEHHGAPRAPDDRPAYYAVGDFEELKNTTWVCGFGLILAAHCIEHMRDAPKSIRKMAAYLDHGGELWIIVPDDSDPVNPDHLWFFTEATLRSTIEAAGLEVVRMAKRKYIERENFIYCRARKPA